MRAEELLAKYLDGSLTQAEETEWISLLESSPDLAEEARALGGLEEALSSQKTILSPADQAYLDSVGERALDAMALPLDGGAAAAGSSTAGSGITGSLTGIVSAAIGGLLILGGVAYLTLLNGEDDQGLSTNAERNTPEAVAVDVPPADLDQVPDETQSASDNDAAATDPQSNALSEPTLTSAPPESQPAAELQDPAPELFHENEASAAEGSSTQDVQIEAQVKLQRIYEDIKIARQQLNKAEQQSNTVGQARAALNLGKLYRQLGKTSHSANYLKIAERFAKAAGLDKIESDAQQELLLLEN